MTKISKVSKLIKAKRLLDKTNTLDAKFLTGQISTPLYKKRRAILIKQFEKLK